jgi:hypothetical protein
MNLGMALGTLGERAQARQALLRAAALAPADEEIHRALQELGPPVVEEDEVTRPTPRGDEMEASIQGNLESFKLLDVLEFLRVQNMTGALVVASKRGEGVVRITAGRISGASAPGVKGLGPTLVEESAISMTVLEAALAQEGSDRDEVLIGALWTSQLIDRERLGATVRRQIMAALAEMLDWSEGAFSFHGGQSAEPPAISFNLHEITLQLAAQADRARPGR